MKKTLIAAAVMAASGVAFAASNVTLYGVMDGAASSFLKLRRKIQKCRLRADLTLVLVGA